MPQTGSVAVALALDGGTYLGGSACNFARQCSEQNRNVWPWKSAWSVERSLTLMPQTGSFIVVLLLVRLSPGCGTTSHRLQRRHQLCAHFRRDRRPVRG